MINLILPPAIQSGSVRVSWCVDKPVMREILDSGKCVEDLYVIVTAIPKAAIDFEHAHYVRNQRRFIFRFGEGAGYIVFARSGEHDLRAVLVHDSVRSDSRVEERWRETDWDGWYAQRLVQCDGRAKIDAQGCIVQNVQRVEIPDGVFAKEPSAAMNAWVNMGFRDRPDDQCSFRRRAIYAFTIQPLIGFIRSLMFLFRCVFGVIFGFWWSARGVIHPFQEQLEAPAYAFATGIIDRYKLEGSWKAGVAFLAAVPLVWLFIGVIVHTLITMPLFSLLVFLGVVLAGVAAGLGVIAGAPRMLTWLDARADKKMADNTEALICGSDVKLNKTLRLRYEDVKAKVCKPFAR
jgi:hypothetical protein